MTLPAWTPSPGFTKLSLKQIQDEFGCAKIIPTPEIDLVRPPLSTPISPPLPIGMGSITITPTSLNETTAKTGTVTYTIANRRGLTIYAQIYHIGTTEADFQGATSWVITADSGSFTFTIKEDAITESPVERFQIAFLLTAGDFGSAFYTSAELSIADTSTYPVWNPRILPVTDAAGKYETTTGTPITIKIVDAKPGSTVTGTKLFTGTGTAWTPNPYPITGITIGSDGTFTDSAATFTLAGTYTYDFVFDNFSPDTLIDGPNRQYTVTVKTALGAWTISPVSPTVEGGKDFVFNYTWTKSDLSQLSYFIVNPGTTTTYSGLGITDKGTAFNITKSDTSNGTGQIKIPTSIVTADQTFAIVLYSGELNNSTKLAELASGITCTIQAKPVIPDLVVTGSNTSIYPAAVTWTITGSKGEEVTFSYVDRNKNNPDYNIYFDYNPDVEAEFKVNNQGKADQFQFAQFHYDTYGKSEGRKSPNELKAIVDSITGGKITLDAKAGSATLGEKLYTITDGRTLLPRTSAYTFTFRGNKAENTKVTPIEYGLTVSNEPRLLVVPSGKDVGYGEPIRTDIYGPAAGARIDWTGATTGFVLLDHKGYASPDLRGGTNLPIGVHNWKFNSVVQVRDKDVPFTATVKNFLIGITRVTTIPAGDYRESLISGSANAFTINVITGDNNIIASSNPVWKFTGQPGSTANAVSANDKFTVTFDSKGLANMPYEIGAPRTAGTQVYTITGSGTTTPFTLTIITTLYDEKVRWGLTSPATSAGPFTMAIKDKLYWAITGGVNNSTVNVLWAHNPSVPGGLDAPTTVINPSAPAGLETPLGAGGSLAGEHQWAQRGTYNYTLTFRASGNVRTSTVIVRQNEFKVTPIDYTHQYGYYNNRPIRVKIEGNPGDTINIGTPLWLAVGEISGTTYDESGAGYFRGWNSRWVAEGTDPNYLIYPYPYTNSAWNTKELYRILYSDVRASGTDPQTHFVKFGYVEGRMWPYYPSFPNRTVTLDETGSTVMNINGSNEKSITVQSTHFNMVGPSQWGSLDSYVSVGTSRVKPSSFGRGHTMVVFNPTTLELESCDTYDTWGGTNNRITAIPAFIAKLNALATGKLVVITSYDAISMRSELVSTLNTILGSKDTTSFETNNVGVSRQHCIIIGYARQPANLLAEIRNSSPQAQTITVYPPGVVGGQGAPFWGTYNKPPMIPSGPAYYLDAKGRDQYLTNDGKNFEVRKELLPVNYWQYRIEFTQTSTNTIVSLPLSIFHEGPTAAALVPDPNRIYSPRIDSVNPPVPVE